MTTITFREDINIINRTFISISDFLGEIDSKLLYEEYLERKLQETKKIPNENFLNI